MELVSGDFNGDGLADLAYFRDHEIDVYVGDGLGGFTPGQTLTIGDDRHRLRVVDFDADGFADILSTSYDPAAGIQVLFGAGTSGLSPPLVAPTPTALIHLELRDLDSDGLLDAVGSFEDVRRGIGWVAVKYDAPGLLSGEEFMTVPAAGRAPLGIPCDLNGDGLSDLALWRWSSPHLAVLEGTGERELSQVESDVEGFVTEPSTVKLSSALATDLDRDGRDEVFLFAGNQYRTCFFFVVDWEEERGYVAQQLSHFISYSTGRWTPYTDPSTSVSTEDIDGDGWTDILLLPGYSDRVLVLHNTGETELRFERCDVELSAEATSFACGDYDGDGSLDIAGALRGRIEIVFSAAASCKPVPPCLEQDKSLLTDLVEQLTIADWTPDVGEEVITVGGGTARIRSVEAGGLVEVGSFRVPRRIEALAAGDLDQDGIVDLAMSALGQETLELVFLKEPARGDVERRRLSIGDEASSLIVDDVNDDAVLDLVFATGFGGTVGVAFGEGRGDFLEPIILPVDSFPTGLAVGDLVGDSVKDLVVSVAGQDRILVFEGMSGPNMFQTSRVLVEDVEVSGGLRIADLNGDRENELIAGTEDDSIAVFHNVRQSPRRWQIHERGRFPITTGVYVADLDGDGDAEVIGVTPETRTFTVIRDTGVGRFEWESFLLKDEGLNLPDYRVSAGDVDSDGFVEVLVADSSSGRLTVLRSNRCRTESTFRRGDVNGDGTVNLTDPVTSLQHLFVENAKLSCLDAADADDDGTVNLSDAVSILLYLFNGGAEPAPPGPSDCGSDPSADDFVACSNGCFAD